MKIRDERNYFDVEPVSIGSRDLSSNVKSNISALDNVQINKLKKQMEEKG